MRRLFFSACLGFAIFGFVFPARAINTQSQRVYMPGHRMISIVESKPKQKDNLALQFGFNFGIDPFEFGNSSSGNGIRDIVSQMYTFDFGAGFSFTDRFAVAINVPFHITNNIQSFSNFTKETVVSFGDLNLAAMYTILDPNDSSAGFGLAVVPFLSIPTGDNGNFVGDQTFTGGVLAAADVELGEHYFAANMGVRFREQENFLNLEIGQEFLYRMGYQHYIYKPWDLDGFAEAGGSFVLGNIESNSSPFEVMLGVSKTISEETPLTIKLANGLGVGSGYSAPTYRAALQISYDYLVARRDNRYETTTKVKTTLRQKVEKRLRELTVYYPTNGANVDPFYHEKISEIAEIINDNPDLGTLYIVSHSDSVGSDAYNLRLSKTRSKQAHDEILKYNVGVDRISWHGVGESYPEYPNDSAVNRALNRRTIFTFSKPTYLDGGPAKNAPNVQLNPDNDSFTEVLKEKKRNQTLEEGDYYKEETVIEEVKVKEKVEEKEKIKGEKKRPKRKGRRNPSYSPNSSSYEDVKSGSSSDDDFGENF